MLGDLLTLYDFWYVSGFLGVYVNNEYQKLKANMNVIANCCKVAV